MPNEVAPTVRLDGKTAIVTGANSGIGLETVRELYRRGARVILAVRSATRGEEARAQLEAEVGSSDQGLGSLEVKLLDLASLESVRTFAADINANVDRLELLINNAGRAQVARTETVDGFETTFATNHLGPFLLTLLLQDKLRASKPARVVNVSSMAHSKGTINFNDLQSTHNYVGMTAYGQSKLANVLFTRQLARQFAGSGVTAYSLHPGVIRTAIWRDAWSTWRSFFLAPAWLFMKTAAQGALTTLYCALDPELENVSGRYYSDCKEKEASKAGRSDEDAARLWDLSCAMVGVEDQPAKEG